MWVNDVKLYLLKMRNTRIYKLIYQKMRKFTESEFKGGGGLQNNYWIDIILDEVNCKTYKSQWEGVYPPPHYSPLVLDSCSVDAEIELK